MNDQLKLLYEKYWDSFITNVYKATMKEGKPICAYPFLIQATPHYLNAQKRIMFCGQETLSWGGARIPPSRYNISLRFNGFIR